MKGWSTRLDEVGVHQPTELRWEQIWALVARSLRQHDQAHAQRVLWRLRFASWVKAIDVDPHTCRTCGARLDSPDPRARYCSTACRKMMHNRTQKGQPTPLAELVAQADRTLEELRSEAARGHRMLRRWTGREAIAPPDWTTLDHVPQLPDPCGGGCPPPAGRCPHTQGVCLYARTRHAPED